MTDVKRRTFVWHFDSPVEAIWPVLADTARFNEAANVPKHDIEEIAQADGSVRYMARAQKGPFKLEWEDKPVNWVANRWFRHCRYFQSGPLKFLCATLEFFPDDGGCRGEYTIETEAANLLGRLILGTRFFPATERNFGRLADNAREFGAGRAEREFEVEPPTLVEGAIERARHLVSQIEVTPYGHGLAQRLGLDFLDTGAMYRAATFVAIRRNIDPAQGRQVAEAVKLADVHFDWTENPPRIMLGEEDISAG